MTMDSCLLAIEIGGTKLQLVVGSHEGRVHHRLRLKVEPARGGLGIRQQIEAALPEILNQYQPRAIGVGFGGPVDRHSGSICCSHQIEGWSDFPLGRWLKDLSGLPAVVENDANTAALGEALHGAGSNLDPVFYVTLGSGVGGGLVAGRSLYHGAKPGEAEIGHVRLDRFGTTVEQRCSGWAVDARVRATTAANPDSALARLTAQNPGAEARQLAPALVAGDPVAERLLDEVAEDLSFGLSHAVHLFHPAAIVLGGGLSLVGESLRSAVAKHLPRFVMEAFSPGPQIRLAALGEDSVPIGALCLPAQVGVGG